MGDTIFAMDGKKFVETAFPTRVLCFRNLVRVSKLQMGVIKEHDFEVTSEMVMVLLMVWDMAWKRDVKIRKGEISCLAEAVVVGICGGLQE